MEESTLSFEIQRKKGEEDDGECCSEIESPPSMRTHRRFHLASVRSFFLKEEGIRGAVED